MSYLYPTGETTFQIDEKKQQELGKHSVKWICFIETVLSEAGLIPYDIMAPHDWDANGFMMSKLSICLNLFSKSLWNLEKKKLREKHVKGN